MKASIIHKINRWAIYLILCCTFTATNLCYSQTNTKANPDYKTSSLKFVESDSLSITLDAAETVFLQKNLQLISNKYNISIAQANVIQARVFNNPNFWLEHNLNNKLSDNPLTTGPNGETQAQLTQLFSIAGKRKQTINVAQAGVAVAQQQFFDLLNNLKYQLRYNFFQLYFLQKSERLYGDEIESLDRIYNLYRTQYKKGNIAFQEVVRLRSFLFSLESDRKNLRSNISIAQNNLMILMADSTLPYLVAAMPENLRPVQNIDSLSVGILINNALNSRPDLLALKANINQQLANVKLQKATAVPDLKLGASYDKNGNYYPNYFGGNFSFDLPFFNRNQGGIKAAKAQKDQSEWQYKTLTLQIEKDIWEGLVKARETERLMRNFEDDFLADYQILIAGFNTSYLNKSISLQTYIDFYESYKNSLLQYNQIEADRFSNLANINFLVGAPVITFQ